MKTGFTLLWLCFAVMLSAQAPKTKVLTLGTFHFNFPNLDVKQIGKADQIDVLQPASQREIESITARIARFRPTVIVIERQTAAQGKVDSIFGAYLAGRYSLKRDEAEQLGFRLAKSLGLKKLYCVDEWGSFTDRLGKILDGSDSAEAAKFVAYFERNPDSAKRFVLPDVFKTEGILAQLRRCNDEDAIKKSLGNYLVGLFKYESKEGDFTGADFETGRWFSRNLKIFRNIQRINVLPSDRILVIYGAGHLNLLNYFFDCSPEYRRVKTAGYLK